MDDAGVGLWRESLSITGLAVFAVVVVVVVVVDTPLLKNCSSLLRESLISSASLLEYCKLRSSTARSLFNFFYNDFKCVDTLAVLALGKTLSDCFLKFFLNIFLISEFRFELRIKF
jgi:hypothetical protein